jgi:regulator of nonsense transcripts 2
VFCIVDPTKFRSLDSNIKKNTAFIKKCKTSLQADYQTQLLNDINKLSLEKYISEIVGAVIEGMAKCLGLASTISRHLHASSYVSNG